MTPTGPLSPARPLLCPHLHDLQLLLSGLDELGDGHIDELVLRLRLHHARALGPHHLDGLLDVDVTVQAWPRGQPDVRPRAKKEAGGCSPTSPSVPHQSPSPLVEMLSMSMSMTMMVPVRPMPALGREGTSERPSPHRPGTRGQTAPAGLRERAEGRGGA